MGSISDFDIGAPQERGRHAGDPPRNQWIYKRDGRLFRIIRPLTKTGDPPFGFGPTFIVQPFRIKDNDGKMGWAKQRKIDQAEVALTIDLDPKPVKRLLQGRVMASFQPGEPYVPKFTIQPTLSTFDDCLEVSFSTDRETQALVYYAKIAEIGDTNWQQSPPAMPSPAAWAGSGGPQRRTGFVRYAYYFDRGGYDSSVAVEVLTDDHSVPICGLVSGATYAVRVAIFDQDGRGPTFSREDAVLTLPTLD